MQGFNFKLSVLTTSILDVFRRIRNGEDVHKPIIQYDEPDE